jgi:pimeloyl-ACP methyl ester carboxylesterase
MINEKYNVITRRNKTNPAILLLHGIGADHHMWYLQMDAFANEGYFVIVPDLLGHGKTINVSELTLED